MGPDGGADVLEVLLLGPVEVRVGGRPVQLSGTSQRVVLARLAVAPGRLVPTSDLIDALWPSEPPDNAVGNLQSYLSRLRRALGSDRVAREPGGYRLDIGPEGVDVGRVERLVGEARAVADAHPEEAARLLGEALDCWRGTPLADLPDPLPFAPHLAQWAAWRRQLVEARLQHRVAAGHAAEALPELERAVAADPTSERLTLLWMQALHHLSRTAEALRASDRFRRRMVEESGLSPGPALAELERRLLASDGAPHPRPAPPSTAATWPRRNAPANQFFGRTEEMAAVAAALDRHRIVTVAGPGGVGKTRLVLELLDRLGGTVHLVELGAVPEAAEVATATAAALGLRSAPAGAEAALVDRLAGEPALLVLDNCEHVLGSAAALVATLASRCPDLRILVTSRRRLGVAGERVERLGPLPEEDQVALFGDRAALLRDGFTLDAPEVRAAVADVCRLVDGLPLAVELSASREAVFGVTQLRQRLAAGLEVLDPPRGATRSTAVGAAVEWSYRLLDDRARALFDRLAVCRGGFTVDAVAHFADDLTTNAAAVLAELVEASLVVADHGRSPVRFRLLDTLRYVGRGHLDDRGAAAARDAHARWMLDEAARAGAPHFERSAQPAALVPEVANIRDALAWLVESGQWGAAGRLAVGTSQAMLVHPHLEVLAQLRRLAAAPTDGRCAIGAGAAAFLQGDYGDGERLLGMALDRLPPGEPDRWLASFFRFINRMFTGPTAPVEADATAVIADDRAPRWSKATAVCCSALMRLYHGDRAGAEEWMAGHAALLDEAGSTDGFVPYTWGELASAVDPAAALAWYAEAERRCDEQGHEYVLQLARIGRLAVLVRTGRSADASAAASALLVDLRRLGMWPQLWTTLRLTAELLVDAGDLASAARVLAAADSDPSAPPVAGPDLVRHGDLWRRIRAGLDAGALAAAVAPGARATRAGQAVAQALAALTIHA